MRMSDMSKMTLDHLPHQLRREVVGEEDSLPVVVPPDSHYRVEHSLRSLRQHHDHSLYRHRHEAQEQLRDPVAPRIPQRHHQPQHTPLVRKWGGPWLQHEVGHLIHQQQRLFGWARLPPSSPAGPTLPIDARDAEQHSVLSLHRGEVLVPVRSRLTASRHELRQARQASLALVVERARQERDQSTAEDATACLCLGG